MKQAFNRMFWGYLFVLVEIHFFLIDILAEPVGYYLIFSGIKMLSKDFPIGIKASRLALALIFISIPTVLIQQNVGLDQVGQLPFLSGLSLYMTFLGLVKLILVFYIFQLIMAVVQKHGYERIIRRSSKTFSTYIIVMLLVTISNSFMINFAGDAATGITVFTILISLIMDITFLILLKSLGKINTGSKSEKVGQSTSNLT